MTLCPECVYNERSWLVDTRSPPSGLFPFGACRRGLIISKPGNPPSGLRNFEVPPPSPTPTPFW